MKHLLFCCLSAALLFACKSGSDKTAAGATAADTSTVAKNYFPVLDFLQSEIAYVDSFPLKIMKYTVINGKTDSLQITSAIFKQLANASLPPGLDSASLEKKFRENSFMDQTTGKLTFTYSTKDTANGLKRVDVLASPDMGFDKVKSIYLESTGKDGDMGVTEKIFWKTRESFTVIRVYQPQNQPSYNTQLKLTWDNSH